MEQSLTVVLIDKAFLSYSLFKTLIKIICGFCNFLVGKDSPLQASVLWKCVRRCASEAALKEITPKSHEVITKSCRVVGMLRVSEVKGDCSEMKFSLHIKLYDV